MKPEVYLKFLTNRALRPGSAGWTCWGRIAEAGSDAETKARRPAPGDAWAGDLTHRLTSGASFPPRLLIS